jgi:hypothetical protein
MKTLVEILLGLIALPWFATIQAGLLGKVSADSEACREKEVEGAKEEHVDTSKSKAKRKDILLLEIFTVMLKQLVLMILLSC